MIIEETILKCKDCKDFKMCSRKDSDNICEYFKPSYATKLKFLPFRVTRKIFLCLERIFLKSFPPRVFVSGPIKDTNHFIFLQNISRGLTESRKLMLMGVAIFSPFTLFQINISGPPVFFKRKDFIFANLSFIASSAAMYLITEYSRSDGTVNEVFIAHLLGVPVFTDLSKLIVYLTEKKGYRKNG